MQAVEIPTFANLMSHSFTQSDSVAGRYPVAPAIPTQAVQAVQKTSGKQDRRLVPGCALLILALIDLNCVMWAYPTASQIAEWVGVPILNSIWVGLTAMAATIPLAVVVTIYAWRRIAS